MAQINLTPQRISAMPPMPDADIVTKLEDKDTAATWSMPIDSLCRSSASDRPSGSGLQPGTDEGTLYVPMSRIALRDSNGKIPASMLPGHLDDMIFGSLAVSGGKARFTETSPSGSSTSYVYAAPNRTGDEKIPPQNVIFCDTSNDVQYRFTGDSNTNNEITHYGFTVIPGSRTVTDGYGINIVHNSTTDTISAKQPNYYIGAGSNTFSISNTAVGLGTVTASESSVLTLTSVSSKFTLGSLSTDSNRVSYHVELVLSCIPTAHDAYITKISVKTGSTVLASCDYDMSNEDDVASTAVSKYEDTVSLSFDFTTTTATKDFTIVGEQGHAVTAKLTRISVTELI